MSEERKKEEDGCMNLRMNINENSNQDYLLSSNNLLRKLIAVILMMVFLLLDFVNNVRKSFKP